MINKKYLYSNIWPDIGNVLIRAKDRRLFHEEQGVRHPLGVYSTSLSLIAKRLNTLLDRLDEAQTNYHQSPPSNARWSDELSEATDAFLDATFEHWEAMQDVVTPFFEDKSNPQLKTLLKDFRANTSAYRNHLGLIVNYLKHDQGRIRPFVMELAAGPSIGYFIEGPIPGGGLGPYGGIHAGSNCAISFNRDLKYHVINLYAIGASLASLLHRFDNTLTINSTPHEAHEWAQAIKRVSELPLAFYPDEIHKPVPAVRWGASKLALEYPSANLHPLFIPPQVRSAVIYSGDGVTRTFKIPYSQDISPLRRTK